MGKEKIRLTYQLRKKQPIEHGIAVLLDLKYYFAVYMVIGYGIYALDGHTETMIKDAMILAFTVIFSYILRNVISNHIILLVLQFCIILSSHLWCQYNNEKVMCILFLAGWSIYSLSVRIKENKERTIHNEGLFFILLGIPMEVLADYYQYIPVKSLIFWLGFFMITTHYLIKYMIDFLKYFEQAGQVNVTIKQIKLKSHLLLAGYGVIGMGVMLMMSRLPLQGVWSKIKHGIYLLMKQFFHMLEGEPIQTRWDPSPAPTQSSQGSIVMSEDDSSYIDLKWLRTIYEYIFEMIRIVVIVAMILCVLKLIYTIFQNLNKKEKGIEEEREFIHLAEIRVKKKKQYVSDRTEREDAGNNPMKVRKLFRQIMKKQGIEKYSNKDYMTAHEMCHIQGTEELNEVEKIYQKARYSKENISEEEVKKIREHYKQKRS